MTVFASKNILLDKASALLYLGITDRGLSESRVPVKEGHYYSLEDLAKLPIEYRIANTDYSKPDLTVVVKKCTKKFELLLFLHKLFKNVEMPNISFNSFTEIVSDTPDLGTVMQELRVMYQRDLYKFFDLDRLLNMLSLAGFFELDLAPQNIHTYLTFGPKYWLKPDEISSNGQMFSYSLPSQGIWHLSKNDSVLYSMIILDCGSWGGLSIYDGTRRLLWKQPSAFTGSFVLEGYCKSGLLIDNGHGQIMPIRTTVNWREVKINL
jgi:hypothetical protein